MRDAPEPPHGTGPNEIIRKGEELIEWVQSLDQFAPTQPGVEPARASEQGDTPGSISFAPRSCGKGDQETPWLMRGRLESSPHTIVDYA